MTTALTQRDLDLVETLCRRVRLLPVAEIARGWWPDGGSLRIVRRRLRRLALAGWIQRTTINAHPLLNPLTSLATWTPGQPEPDCDWIASPAQERWREAAIPQEVVFASADAANRFGSSAGSLPRLEQRDHDLLLGQVYVRFRIYRPHEAACWIGEDALPKAGYRIKDPDAFLLNEDGRPRYVIESCGRYDSKQVGSFHDHCHSNDLPYEIW